GFAVVGGGDGGWRADDSVGVGLIDGRSVLWRFSLLLLKASTVSDERVRESLSKTLRSQGWRSRAYRDVFTACFGKAFPHLLSHCTGWYGMPISEVLFYGS
ncbi:MAG: hypothetical protein R6T87_10345, partial [Marinobacter sp.]